MIIYLPDFLFLRLGIALYPLLAFEPLVILFYPPEFRDHSQDTITSGSVYQLFHQILYEIIDFIMGPVSNII